MLFKQRPVSHSFLEVLHTIITPHLTVISSNVLRASDVPTAELGLQQPVLVRTEWERRMLFALEICTMCISLQYFKEPYL